MRAELGAEVLALRSQWLAVDDIQHKLKNKTDDDAIEC